VTAGTAEAGTAAAARAAAVMMAIAGIISSSDIEELFLRSLEEKSFRGPFFCSEIDHFDVTYYDGKG